MPLLTGRPLQNRQAGSQFAKNRSVLAHSKMPEVRRLSNLFCFQRNGKNFHFTNFHFTPSFENFKGDRKKKAIFPCEVILESILCFFVFFVNFMNFVSEKIPLFPRGPLFFCRFGVIFELSSEKVGRKSKLLSKNWGVPPLQKVENEVK